jgi:multiple sugar transport system ATP-binding protein
MAEVVLDRVSKNFGRTAAVADLSLTIADGEFLVLLGPTGAGKTTTLRLVSGLEAPDEGQVRIGGVDVSRQPPGSRDVAMVFQQYSLYPHYSVYDNLAFPLRSPLRKSPEPEVELKVREIARLLRIEEKLANKSTQLSGGEMQRVAIGRALVRSPAIFLMDEPLSSLDAKLREDLRVELKRIQLDLGATILYVTHDQIEAMTLADRIGVLREGTLVQVGTPERIYRCPDTLYVACRLGSPQINQVPPGGLGVSDVPAGTETVAVRPEDLTLGEGGCPARLLAVEHYGAETVVLAEAEGRRVHALPGPNQTCRPGDETGLKVRPGAALYFDGQGRRIAAEAPGREETILEVSHGG